MLNEFGERLIQENHYDAQNIATTLDAVSQRRTHIKSLSTRRKQNLADSLLYQQFNRDRLEVSLICESPFRDYLKSHFRGTLAARGELNTVTLHWVHKQ